MQALPRIESGSSAGMLDERLRGFVNVEGNAGEVVMVAGHAGGFGAVVLQHLVLLCGFLAVTYEPPMVFSSVPQALPPTSTLALFFADLQPLKRHRVTEYSSYALP